VRTNSRIGAVIAEVVPDRTFSEFATWELIQPLGLVELRHSKRHRSGQPKVCREGKFPSPWQGKLKVIATSGQSHDATTFWLRPRSNVLDYKLNFEILAVIFSPCFSESSLCVISARVNDFETGTREI
jgi:hypothetical protein